MFVKYSKVKRFGDEEVAEIERGECILHNADKNGKGGESCIKLKFF